MSDDLSKRHLLADETDESPVTLKNLYPDSLQSKTLLYYRGSLCIASVILLMSVLLNVVLLFEDRPGPHEGCTQRSPYSISHSCNVC